MVLNTPLHHLKTQTIFQAKRKVAHTKITTKTSTMNIFFFVKVLARSGNSRNHLDKKYMIFSITTDLFPKKFLRSIRFNFRYSVE